MSEGSPRRGTPPVFLERQSYRRRRVMDAARVLPFLGALLWLVPLLWQEDPEQGVRSSEVIVYLFGVWLLLVLLAGFIASVLGRPAPGDGLGSGGE